MSERPPPGPSSSESELAGLKDDAAAATWIDGFDDAAGALRFGAAFSPASPAFSGLNTTVGAAIATTEAADGGGGGAASLAAAFLGGAFFFFFFSS